MRQTNKTIFTLYVPRLLYTGTLHHRQWWGQTQYLSYIQSSWALTQRNTDSVAHRAIQHEGKSVSPYTVLQNVRFQEIQSPSFFAESLITSKCEHLWNSSRKYTMKESKKWHNVNLASVTVQYCARDERDLLVVTACTFTAHSTLSFDKNIPELTHKTLCENQCQSTPL